MFLYSRQIITGIAFAVILNPPPGGSLRAETDPLEILFPYEWVGNIDKIKFSEPSGIVFHRTRGTLFVVGDNGDICEIQPDGTLVKQKHIRRADFEGITYDPSTGLLYAAIEGEEKIVEFDPDSFAEMRTFSIGRTFQDQALLKSGEGGIEGITFVPKPGHPHGGTFYVANQSFDLTRAEDISAIFEIEVPLRSESKADSIARIVSYFNPGVIDLSGLHYDAPTDQLLVVSDATNALFQVTRAGRILRSYAFPGTNQEGITLGPEGFLYIAQGSGGIVKIKWIRAE